MLYFCIFEYIKFYVCIYIDSIIYFCNMYICKFMYVNKIHVYLSIFIYLTNIFVLSRTERDDAMLKSSDSIRFNRHLRLNPSEAPIDSHRENGGTGPGPLFGAPPVGALQKGIRTQ